MKYTEFSWKYYYWTQQCWMRHNFIIIIIPLQFDEFFCKFWDFRFLLKSVGCVILNHNIALNKNLWNIGFQSSHGGHLSCNPSILSAEKYSDAKMSVKIKRLLISAWNNLTIEPVVFFCLTSFGLSTVTRANLLLDKACYVKLNYTEEICKNLTGDYLTNAEKAQCLKII